jgi:hypothetical protein
VLDHLGGDVVLHVLVVVSVVEGVGIHGNVI